jgi:hypothetical protein
MALTLRFTAPSSGIAHVAFDRRDSLRSRKFIISWLSHTQPLCTLLFGVTAASATLATRRLARP